LLAMVVNDYACLLAKHGALESIASKPQAGTRSYMAFSDHQIVHLAVLLPLDAQYLGSLLVQHQARGLELFRG